MLSVLNEAIVMSTQNIQFHDKNKKISLNICFLELSRDLHSDSKTKRVRNSHGKRDIDVRVIKVLLYFRATIDTLNSRPVIL